MHLQNLLWIMVKTPKFHPSNPRKFSPGTLITCHLTFIHSHNIINNKRVKYLPTYLPTYKKQLPTTTTPTGIYGVSGKLGLGFQALVSLSVSICRLLTNILSQGLQQEEEEEE